MSLEIKIPEVGESIAEVQIGAWLKSEGDSIAKEQPLVTIDSEKTTFDLPAPEAGTLTKILHQTGETVAVGTVIAQFEAGEFPKKPGKTGEPASSKASAKAGPSTATEAAPAAPAKSERLLKPAAKKSAPDTAPIPEPPSSTPAAENAAAGRERPDNENRPAPESESPPAAKPAPSSPSARKPARPPLPAAANKAPSDRELEVVPMTMLRRTVARRLVEAQQQMAMLTTFNEVDLTAVQGLRRTHQEAFEKRYQVKLGLMSFFVKAAIDALKIVPQLNAEVRENDIVYHNYFDIGVAIATERGLVVPVLRNAERLGFAATESAIAEFARRAREGGLKPDDLEGGTFTITNGGVFGSLLSTPIINPPQSAILGLHTIQERPIALDHQVVIRPMMYMALTYDHRIVDGREAVTFLRRIKDAIESPARMLLEV